jgi:L-fuconolactonase
MYNKRPVIVDAHQHFFDFTKIPYVWPTSSEPSLYRNIVADELEPLLIESGIQQSVIVQADHSDAETDYMLEVGAAHNWVAGVVGWVPLYEPERVAERLTELLRNPLFKGVRHLIHNEQNPDWVLQPQVLEGLRILAERDIPFDVVAVLPRHLEHVPVLAEKVPGLRMVIDHLAKPPIQAKEWEPWASLLKRAAEYPQVYAKVSGLNTAADWANWSADDLKPYIDHALDCFGANRLMFGSDWPVADLAGDYNKVWTETKRAIDSYSVEEQNAILGETAVSFYKLQVREE